MTAKERLEHVRLYRQGIQSLNARLEELYLSVEGLKATYRFDINRLLDVSAEYTRTIRAYREEIQTITGRIDSLKNPAHREVLNLRYMNEKRFKYSQIAEIIHRSEGRVRHLHTDALRAFEQVAERKG